MQDVERFTGKESITLRDVVDFLNAALQSDRIGISNLFLRRVTVNRTLAEHPTLQVAREQGNFYTSPLGLLNGLFGRAPDGKGAIWYDTNQGRLGEARIVRFYVRAEPAKPASPVKAAAPAPKKPSRREKPKATANRVVNEALAPKKHKTKSTVEE
jgi:hypothetical protein